MRKLFSSFILIALPLLIFSQNIAVKSFRLLENDLDAQVNYPEVDRSNGEKAALIKIVTTETGFDFGGGQLGIVKVVYKTAEVWVYVPTKLKAITIAHPKLGQLPDRFYNFNIPIVSGKVYLMELVTGTVETTVKPIEVETQWLAINSKPEGANVFIEEQLVGTTPFSRKYPEGEYSYRIEFPKYNSNAGKVSLAGDKKVLEITLKPRFGSIKIASTPESGMQIYLNDENTGKITPATLEGVASGEHTLKLMSQWYQPQSKRVVVTDEQTIVADFTMTSAFADITVTTNPSANISVDGKSVGNGTYTARMMAGIYTVKAEKDKHYPQQQQLTVVAGNRQAINLSLKPMSGSLDVASTPFDATITIDGKEYGTTPNTIKNLLVGDYTLTLKKVGYGTITKTITIKENATTEMNEKLPTGMEVTITSAPTGAQIYLDGVLVGSTPYVTTLSFGSHPVKLVNGKKVVEETITIAQNSKTRFEYNMAELNANNLNIEMISLQGGTFQMGSNQSEDEKPIHSVTLSNFHIGKYEVTQAQWRAIMGSNPSYNKNCDNCPVEQVSWNDVQDFIKKLNAKTGKTFRLPTEAEWEYAARGGNMSYTYSGSNDIGGVAWYDANSGGITKPVGGKQPNKLDIYDMTGNVFEWCSDWYNSSYYANSPLTNPRDKSSGTVRVYRGGSFGSRAVNCRVAYRIYDFPDSKRNFIGFRLALSAK